MQRYKDEIKFARSLNIDCFFRGLDPLLYLIDEKLVSTHSRIYIEDWKTRTKQGTIFTTFYRLIPRNHYDRPWNLERIRGNPLGEESKKGVVSDPEKFLNKTGAAKGWYTNLALSEPQG